MRLLRQSPAQKSGRQHLHTVSLALAALHASLSLAAVQGCAFLLSHERIRVRSKLQPFQGKGVATAGPRHCESQRLTVLEILEVSVPPWMELLWTDTNELLARKNGK